ADKTGTLTEGKPRLTGAVPAGGIAENELLRLAASLERGSEHPRAAAIVSGAAARGLALADASMFHMDAGKGVTGVVDGHQVAVGNRIMLVALGIDADALAAEADRLRR